MDLSVEFLIDESANKTSMSVVKAAAEALNATGLLRGRMSRSYSGRSRVVVAWGVGLPSRSRTRATHLAAGGRFVSLDLGYFGRTQKDRYLRVSVDKDHPTQYMDKTPSDPSRLSKHGLTFSNVANPKGPIMLVGVGPKSKIQHRCFDWEVDALVKIRREDPAASIVYRPKKLTDVVPLGLPISTGPIEQALVGIRKIVCRHSNVALDATLAGVPFECEDGIARWAVDKPFTLEVRQELLAKACWWQWRVTEFADMWKFLIPTVELRS